MNKLIVFLTVFTILAVAVAGCTPQAAEQKAQKVVYLINGSLGDNAFYNSGQKGMETIKEKYGVEIRTIECGLTPPSTSRPSKPLWAMPIPSLSSPTASKI